MQWRLALSAPYPKDEEDRLAAVSQVWDTLDSQDVALDSIVTLVSQMLDVSVVMITLVKEETQHVVARYGTSMEQGSRAESLCSYVVFHRHPVVVRDARRDPRFAQNSLVHGSFGLVSYLGVPLLDGAGKVLGSLCAIETRQPRDFDAHNVEVLSHFSGLVMEHLFLRLKLRQAKALSDAKSIFLASMSHEFRTPLNAIVGYSELIREDFEEVSSPGLQQDINAIQFASQHMLSLINNVLDFSKLEAGKLQVHLSAVSLTTLFQEVCVHTVPLLKDTENTLSVLTVEATVLADDVRLRQVLINLLSNANKFTRGGTITLGAKVSTSGEVAELWVEDSGIGIAQEELESIFEEYNQESDTTALKYGGTGLGLSICKRLCELMNGSIFVTSTKGEGSRFTVVLPLAESAHTFSCGLHSDSSPMH